MNTLALQALIALAVVLYCALTLIIVRRRPGHLWTCAAAVAVGGLILYWQAYAYAGAWMPRLVMTILASLDLFIFRANTMGPVAPFFFGEGNILHLIIL
ncbi:MAG: hypothetical protein IKZ60_06480, partial [Bacteroidales bacterium]|nr:hypothetical protein [Bacteroidales bacterium]